MDCFRRAASSQDGRMMIETLLQTAEIPPLRDRILVAAIGPVVTAVLGTGIIGFILWKVSDKANENRSDLEKERAKAERELEHERAQHEFEGSLRHDMLTATITTSAELYFATQHYWRVNRDEEAPDDEKQEARKTLDEQYLKSRAAGDVLEARLEALFATDQPTVAWHRIVDLLTVRYMQLTDQATGRLYEINERGFQGKEHSGLSKADLENPAALLAAYHRASKSLVPIILSTPLRRSDSAKAQPQSVSDHVGETKRVGAAV